MPHIFDCSCRLRVPAQDVARVHELLKSFNHLPDDRDEVVGALFASGSESERIDLMLWAQDVATARHLAKGILAEIEAHLAARMGASAVRAEAVLIRSTPIAPTPPTSTEEFARRLHAELQAWRPRPIEDYEAELRDVGTSGPDGRPSTEDLLAKLDEWRVYSRFDVVEIGPTNLTLVFGELPQQLERFAEEVLLLCPEVTDEVDELEDMEDASPAAVARAAVAGIARNLSDERTLRLWWD